MAAKGGSDPAALVKKTQEFAKLAGSKDPNQITSKGIGKLAGDCWAQKYKNVKTTVDASVFPKCKEPGKPHMIIDGPHMHKFCRCVAHEIVKGKKGAKTPETDPEIDDVCNELECLVISGGPNVKETKISKTGGVDKMTDASQYTGAHKERFDESGKGKGAAGRVDKVENKGYVGAYKGEGTYDKKK